MDAASDRSTPHLLEGLGADLRDLILGSIEAIQRAGTGILDTEMSTDLNISQFDFFK